MYNIEDMKNEFSRQMTDSYLDSIERGDILEQAVVLYNWIIDGTIIPNYLIELILDNLDEIEFIMNKWLVVGGQSEEEVKALTSKAITLFVGEYEDKVR